MTVYFIQEADNPSGLIKIGYSKKAKNRLKTIQNMSPTRLDIIGTIDGNRKYEASIHKLFADKRVYGEWFECCNEIMSFMASPLKFREIKSILNERKKEMERNKQPTNGKVGFALSNVLTAAEAEQLYNLKPGTVRRACREGRVKSRHSGGTWLTTKSEMDRVYGDKKK